jgi:hypothetical protein
MPGPKPPAFSFFITLNFEELKIIPEFISFEEYLSQQWIDRIFCSQLDKQETIKTIYEIDN